MRAILISSKCRVTTASGEKVEYFLIAHVYSYILAKECKPDEPKDLNLSNLFITR
jgi:hypothetical protein